MIRITEITRAYTSINRFDMYFEMSDNQTTIRKGEASKKKIDKILFSFNEEELNLVRKHLDVDGMKAAERYFPILTKTENVE